MEATAPPQPAATAHATTTHAAKAEEAKKPRAAVEQAVFYDLAAHPEHAELRHDDTLVVNLGAPGAAKYTLGGWGTRIRGPQKVADTDVALIRGTYGDVLLPVQPAGANLIEVRARAPASGQLAFYLDSKLLRRVKVDPGTFSRIRLQVDPLAAGEHTLRVRSTGMGRMGSVRSAVALDWVAVGTETFPPAAPPSLRAPSDRLDVPSGYTLGYAFQVPQGARLNGDVAAAPGGVLRVVAQRDGQPEQVLADLPPGRFDLSLEDFAGQVIRLDLVAPSGDTGIRAPRVMVPRLGVGSCGRPVRNVLIYLIDTLRVDHLKAFNPRTRVRTPGFDKLAAQGGALFTAAHTQENWTKPSVATLLSARLPWEHHAVTTEAVVPAGIELLPERLRGLGFYTGAFIANGYVSDKFGFKRGWDTYRNYIREHLRTRSKFVAADVIQWLDARPKGSPFFLYVHAIDPHVPYRPTRQFMQLYDPQPYRGVVSFSRDATLLEKIKVGKLKLNARDKVHLEALYDSEISYHDQHFRSVLEALDQAGLRDETMIIVVADHGEEFWDHGSVGHGHSVYEELLHIPMAVRVPGCSGGAARIASPVGLVDVVPTVLEALGEEVPAGLSGRSFVGELTGNLSGAPRVSVSGFMDDWRTLVAGGFKLVQQSNGQLALYDLQQDPGERQDVAAQRPIATRHLRAQLGLVLASSADPDQNRGGRGKKRRIQRDTTDIDPETEAQLRALGYVGSSRR